MTRRIKKGEDGNIRYATLGCAHGGNARNRTLNVSRPRPTGKIECKAKINALKVDKKFRLTTINNIHNHDLSPTKSRFFRCNREVSDSVKRVLNTNDLVDIRMNKSFGSLVVGAGGFENLPFLENDCRNYINKERHLRLGKGGAEALREKVQQQITGIIDMDPKLLKNDGAVKTYRIDDEVCVEEFTKPVIHYVDFSEEDTIAKSSCGLFQMMGILCRHILAVFKCNEVKFVPNRYILERWRKDIRRRYMLIHSSFDAGDQRVDANRYSSLLNIYYKMITLAASSKKHTKDATYKLFAMIDLYGDNQDPLSMTVTDSNVGCMANDTIICGSSKKVFSPLAVKGKGRPPLLRRASGMEKCMRNVKTKTKRAPMKGKRKHVDFFLLYMFIYNLVTAGIDKCVLFYVI
ncbi:hypothetical protein F2P56_030686 [Juglans regia]|uniref:SWIM-type domain-containing protein n=2 Tax=Juglans regia TaxID=51240 RepID=A0A833X8I8_JUGRE|nr:uncharacterized protein LOC109003939 [Juglans regia]KAF5450325.1 hypothetical protein F2P56_030686 [Juglans regia]